MASTIKRLFRRSTKIPEKGGAEVEKPVEINEEIISAKLKNLEENIVIPSSLKSLLYLNTTNQADRQRLIEELKFLIYWCSKHPLTPYNPEKARKEVADILKGSEA